MVSGIRVFGSTTGQWKVIQQTLITGIPLPSVSHLDIRSLEDSSVPYAWKLSGVISNIRYAEGAERKLLLANQEGLGRSNCDCAALLPIKKSAEWWGLAQDERRKIFEDQSRHIAANMKYLPAIARQLYHSRDLGEEFDFLTWFEFRSEDQALFDDMIYAFRETEEWKYVEREIDLRLKKIQ